MSVPGSRNITLLMAETEGTSTSLQSFEARPKQAENVAVGLLKSRSPLPNSCHLGAVQTSGSQIWLRFGTPGNLYEVLTHK